jgi:hypothetical protein
MKMAQAHHCPKRSTPFAGAASALLLAMALGMPGQAHAQAPHAKPEAAADALILALATNDDVALARVLGKDWRQLLGVEDLGADNVQTFLQKSSQSRVVNAKGGRAELVVGSDPWTLPIPIMHGKDGQWRFDTVAARDEMLVRRIGANELAAIVAVQAYVDAQRDYALADRNGDGLLEYAQKLNSSPGQRDGLIWSASLGDDSPLGEAFLPAKPGEGYHGYRFKILTEQGPAARGGARSYMIGKRMVSGFALVAWPVTYGTTGVMSFMVGSDGKVVERDLGPNSAKVAAGIKQFNPDNNWKPARP